MYKHTHDTQYADEDVKRRKMSPSAEVEALRQQYVQFCLRHKLQELMLEVELLKSEKEMLKQQYEEEISVREESDLQTERLLKHQIQEFKLELKVTHNKLDVLKGMFKISQNNFSQAQTKLTQKTIELQRLAKTSSEVVPSESPESVLSQCSDTNTTAHALLFHHTDIPLLSDPPAYPFGDDILLEKETTVSKKQVLPQ